jgi:hypothetical protein
VINDGLPFSTVPYRFLPNNPYARQRMFAAKQVRFTQHVDGQLIVKYKKGTIPHP